MKICRYLIVFIFFVFACKQEIIDKPDNLISKEKMADIYFDVSLWNAAKSTNMQVINDHSILPQEYIFKKYGIDSVQLAQSSIYYASQPNLHAEIFKDVEERLTTLKEEITAVDKEKQEAMRKQREVTKDSLDKLRDSLKINRKTDPSEN